VPYIFSDLKELVSRGDNLPTLPTIVLQLHRVLEDPAAGPAQVAGVIAQDPALTARLLRTVNSAAYARSAKRITSVDAAVSLLGTSQVRSVCVVHAVASAFGNKRGRLDPKEFWAHSATVAALTSNLWVRVGDTRSISADDAYVVGLLHDVGLLVLDQHFGEDFASVLDLREDPDEPLAGLEETELGIDHGAVGGLLLGRWSLPGFVAEAVSHHNAPCTAPSDIRCLSAVLAAAEAMCWQMDLGLAIEGRPIQPAAVLLRSLGVSAPEVRGIIESTCDVHSVAAAFLG
jgi:HD-like signal output (HDOD) protein